MKKYIPLLIVAITAVSPLWAQSDTDRVKGAWVDLQIGQQISLNDWSNVGYVNDGLASTSIIELRGVLNLYFLVLLSGHLLISDLG